MNANALATAQDLYATDVAFPVLATAELYGSKLVAAMDVGAADVDHDMVQVAAGGNASDTKALLRSAHVVGSGGSVLPK
jgi:hypothetical protein